MTFYVAFYEIIWEVGEMTNMNVSLPETLKEYVENQVAQGGYGTVSEYLRELIRADKKRKAEDHLEALLLEGLDSGDAIPYTPQLLQEIWARVDAKYKAKREAGSSR